MATLHVNGVTLSYTDTGMPPSRSDAPAIVFGHSLLFGGWMFGEQIAALKPHNRCITLDWRGQGDTPATSGGYDMDTLTADAVALIQQLDVAPVHWVGVSMGGFHSVCGRDMPKGELCAHCDRIAGRDGDPLAAAVAVPFAPAAGEPVT